MTFLIIDGRNLSRKKQPSIFRALPGYPWLPCPICGGIESCDDSVLERARAAHPGLIIPDEPKGDRP